MSFFDETDSLFDIFDTENEVNDLTKIKPPVPIETIKPIKRTIDEDKDSESDEVEDSNKVTKKPKIDNIKTGIKPVQNPILADDFEQNVQKDVKFNIDEYELKEKTKNNENNGAIENVNITDNTQLVSLQHQVRHQVALPPNYNYIPISQHKPSENPARTYPFTLDPFQQCSINCIQRNESVLVSAHTSAGKTVVAEYAIAQGLRDKQRVVYTSPIKALSNQKFRELSQEFGDVGLMTGDVTINPNASCLVMTTEILRSMLYRGSEVMREISWVVFDEIHYMRDKERGVVWEETIILLPNQVHYVFLSATIPNAFQFAEWICKIHEQPCHVVYTDYRPTPLQHYLFPAGGDGIHLAVDEKGVFREDNFQRAISYLGDKDDDSKQKAKGKGKKQVKGKGQTTDLYKIIKMIMTRNYQPVIVFSFAKRECENNALMLSKLDFNNEEEKEMIHSVYTNAISSLSEDDQQLPQIEHLLPLLKRGIGIHHSGLLPILKEVIEILFQEGLIKVLFATETFSIGLNMPAKTVLFTSVRKFDGKENRWVSGGEYIQMSGRAGRRGLDDRGIVILMLDEKMEPAVAKGMLKGVADRLNSAFHLSYNMILNLLRVEGISPEFMLERCFYQFQNCAKIPELIDDLSKLEDEKNAIKIENESEIAEYYEIRKQLNQYKRDKRTIMNNPQYILPYLQTGRLVRIRIDDKVKDVDAFKDDDTIQDYGWGVIISIQKRINQNKQMGEDAPPKYILDVLLYCAPGTEKNPKLAKPCPKRTKGEMVVLQCNLSTIDGVSTIRTKVPSNLKSSDARNQVYKTLQETKKRFKNKIPLLDPVEHMNIKETEFINLLKKIEILENRLDKCEIKNEENLEEIYNKYHSKIKVDDKIKVVKKEIQHAQSVLQLDELKARKRILRRLGYTSSADIIELKGRVACEISTGDELILTEMIFNGLFNELTVEQTVALLSCFVFQENSKEENYTIREELKGPYRTLQETARRIAKVSIESKLGIDEEEYVKSFTPQLMDMVFAWCNGAKFSQICKMTDIFEGSIIRAIRRLEELLRQMCIAAKSIGNTELENKFSEGISKIHRDIVFAASLYL
ncbi:antiviral helicase [Piromyces finnis]|uniref:Antiviral helicase n=1 Tax=Piromyces finnis TaxID=1754191 RepID=A0A1Y1VND3_9FUNG|nr:antiviral helicase [Piromyces finnis]|eukprot:ORX60926.1 antiviral helicase [Piromyces finnis]